MTLEPVTASGDAVGTRARPRPPAERCRPARRLRAIKARVARAVADAKVTRVVTVHDGYAYLMQELGIEIAAVVEPALARGAYAADEFEREMQRNVDVMIRALVQEPNGAAGP